MRLLIGAILVTAWAVAMWWAFIHVMRRAWGPYFASRRKQRVRVHAVVKARQGRQELNPVTWEPEFTQKVLVFECEDGVDRDFEVHDRAFDWVNEGDDGVLIYQGELYVDFESRRPRHDFEQIYKRMTRS
jgi:hypothetical protein